MFKIIVYIFAIIGVILLLLAGNGFYKKADRKSGNDSISEDCFSVVLKAAKDFKIEW